MAHRNDGGDVFLGFKNRKPLRELVQLARLIGKVETDIGLGNIGELKSLGICSSEVAKTVGCAARYPL